MASGIDRIVLSHSHTRGSSPADRTRVSTLAVCGAARFPLWSASAMFTRRRKVRAGERTHFRLMTPGDEFVKKLERFIGGTSESTNENTSIRYAFYSAHAFKSKFVRERHLHCTARLPIQPSSSTVIFLHTRKATTNHFGGPPRGGDDDDDLEAESQDRRSGCRQCREDGYVERRVDDEGHEAEESPSHKGAVRARGEASLELQGVQRLSARS